MAIETANETLCINQIIGKKTDTAIVEEDFVVPDIKPDILNAINTNGTICIYKKEVIDGKLKIEGGINTYIMYLADDEDSTIRSLNVNLDFSHAIEFSNLKEGMMVDSNISIKSIECRVLNGRKISVRAMLDITVDAYSNENLEFIQEINDIKDIQLLRENFKINSLFGTGTTKVYAKDTLVIDNTDNLAEIMKVNFEIKNQETKISYNKVLIKADASVKIMYLTEDKRICIMQNTIPIMGFVDMQNISDDNICDAKFEIKNILLKPNSVEEHSIYVEAEIEIMCNVYETKNIDIIQDLYSPTANLIYKPKMIRGITQSSCTKDVYSVREKQNIPEIGNNKIYDVEVLPYINNQTITKDRIIYEGEVQIKFLFASQNNTGINVKSITIPFNYNMSCTGVNEESNINTQIQVLMQDFIVMSDESIDVKIDLEFAVNISNSQNINVIQEIDVSENGANEKSSIIIYFVKRDDTLWKIAKRFKSTVSAIAKINDIEDENKINVGEQLFIPMSI